jgi:predicted RecB family nuclease
MFSATAIANFLACHHLMSLDRAEGDGGLRKPYFADPGMELLRKLGLQHEESYLHALQQDPQHSVTEIPNHISWADAVSRTLEAMRRGVCAIYQPTFQEQLWGGQADFLIRVDTPSVLGAWSYEVVETKLARSAKTRAIIQLCFYSDALSRIQGVEPHWMHLVLGGTSNPEKFPVQHYSAYFRKARREFDEAWQIAAETYPEPVEHCGICDWSTICEARWRADDHLSLVAGITRNQRKALTDRNVTTLAGLGAMPLAVGQKLDGIGATALLRIREQARLQLKGRQLGRPIHELLLPVQPEEGLAALPAPSPGDMFLDLEGDPYADDLGLDYLFGMMTPPNQPDTQPVYESIWSFDAASEKAALAKFIDTAMERLARYPDMHIYHYAAYEPTHIKRMAGRYGICIDELDRLLRGCIFVDLYRVVRQGVRASVESYSIKKIEALYGFDRAITPRDAVLALQEFEALSAFGKIREAPPELLATIESYNRDDCLSTLRLRDWLEDRRTELEKATGQPLPRPAIKSGDPGEDLADDIRAVTILKDRLLAGLPADETAWNEEHRALWLLAQLLEWHRREDKSAWREYFELRTLSAAELIENKNAMGGMTYVGEVGTVDRSIIHRYRFPPQEHAIDRANELRDPKTGKAAGTLVSIDEQNGTLDLKRGMRSAVPHPGALIPYNIVGATVIRDSLLRLGKWVADHGISGHGEFKAARDLLLRLPPGALATNTGPIINGQQATSERGKRLIESLCREASVLAIQGPPGSGKTYTGARMVIELVKQGRKVGITAGSHKVISNLLEGICKAAEEAGVDLRVVQKGNDIDGCEHRCVTQVDNDEISQALSCGVAQVAAGSPWLWSREDKTGCVDVLFVDEAGQMSLANVLAISQAAKSVVLLGDPQQLDQPQRGIHPPGAEASALSHLLNGQATMPADKGLFLAETWRLHPDICAFTSEVFYDGKLKARLENANQRLNTRGPLDGTGLRFIPVPHTGNENESPEEVESVAEIVCHLLASRTTWTDKHGKTVVLTLPDILIVAPYNAHISALRHKLRAGARIGTVDKFQGQEAPVVIYSMATSTPEDAPRGMEFLYSLNRLNVAVSRARCVAVIIASPALFTVQCKTVRQIELANACCRYLEMVADHAIV